MSLTLGDLDGLSSDSDDEEYIPEGKLLPGHGNVGGKKKEVDIFQLERTTKWCMQQCRWVRALKPRLQIFFAYPTPHHL
jgi:hypothetical protein